MTEQSVLSCLLGPRAPDPFWLALPCGAAEQHGQRGARDLLKGIDCAAHNILIIIFCPHIHIFSFSLSLLPSPLPPPPPPSSS